MALDLSTAIPIFNVKYNLAKTIKSKNTVSQKLISKNILPVTSSTAIVSNKNCNTVKIKKSINYQSKQNLIQKTESDQNLSGFSALRPDASPPTKHDLLESGIPRICWILRSTSNAARSDVSMIRSAGAAQQ